MQRLLDANYSTIMTWSAALSIDKCVYPFHHSLLQKKRFPHILSMSQTAQLGFEFPSWDCGFLLCHLEYGSSALCALAENVFLL